MPITQIFFLLMNMSNNVKKLNGVLKHIFVWKKLFKQKNVFTTKIGPEIDSVLNGPNIVW